MASSTSVTPARRSSRRRLQLPPHSDAPPIPPRLRSTEMLQQIRLNAALRSPIIASNMQGVTTPLASPGLRGVPAWFDHDEFSIQGPNAAMTPVSTATIHDQTPRTTSSGPPSIVAPALHHHRSKSSPPILEPLAGLAREPDQFPFPMQTSSSSNSVPLGFTHKVVPQVSKLASSRKEVPP